MIKYKEKDLYGNDRLFVIEQVIPGIEAKWKDVINLSPIKPEDLKKALETAGYKTRELKFYQIDPHLLDQEKTTVCLFNYDVKSKKFNESYVPFEPSDISKYTIVPEDTKIYFKNKSEAGEKPLLFLGIPHVLHKGSINISDLEKFPVITV